ncbi:hypothetical protein [Azotobacter armeniacus]
MARQGQAGASWRASSLIRVDLPETLWPDQADHRPVGNLQAGLLQQAAAGQVETDVVQLEHWNSGPWWRSSGAAGKPGL